jgi:hypothetical protein
VGHTIHTVITCFIALARPQSKASKRQQGQKVAALHEFLYFQSNVKEKI